LSKRLSFINKVKDTHPPAHKRMPSNNSSQWKRKQSTVGFPKKVCSYNKVKDTLLVYFEQRKSVRRSALEYRQRMKEFK